MKVLPLQSKLKKKIMIANFIQKDHLEHKVEINAMFVEVSFNKLIVYNNYLKRLWSLGC